MMELYIPPIQIVDHVNPFTGRFMKGHIPANKGKKWSEFMPKRSQKRCKKGWKNLEKYRCKGHPNAGRNRKEVIAVRDNGSFTVYPSIKGAARAMGILHENVRRCCQENGEMRIDKRCGKINTDHKYMGLRFYYESDIEIWRTKINQ